MKKIIFLTTLFLCVHFFGCKKEILQVEQLQEAAATSKTNSSATVRDGSTCPPPGELSVENGLLKFPTVESYSQTLAFLNCAKEADIQNWRNNLPVETARRAYLDFLSEVCCDQITSLEQMEAIEEEYADKIAILTDPESGDTSYDLKTEYFSEFVNQNGLFMVGSGYYKVIGTQLFSILNGTFAQAMNVTASTPPSTGTGLGGTTILVNDVVLRNSGDCCPSRDEEITLYNDGQNRVRVKYFILDMSIRGFDQTSQEYYVDQNVQYSSFAYNEQKIRLGIFRHFWVCLLTDLSFDSTIKFTTNATVGGGQALPVEFSGSRISLGHCISEVSLTTGFGKKYCGSTPCSWQLEVCVFDVNVVGVNLIDNVGASLDCENTNTFEPRIRFMKNGDEVCTIDLATSVGHIDFTNYAPCDNDEARQVQLINLEPGTILKIFDHSGGSLNDDHMIITIHEPIYFREIFSLEQTINETDFTATYVPFNGLNGKVSSFSDQ